MDELVPLRISVFQKHLDYLEKINNNNQSEAVRTIIDQQIHQQKVNYLDKYVIYIALGLIAGALSFLPYQWIRLLSLVAIALLTYSAANIIMWVIRK